MNRPHQPTNLVSLSFVFTDSYLFLLFSNSFLHLLTYFICHMYVHIFFQSVTNCLKKQLQLLPIKNLASFCWSISIFFYRKSKTSSNSSITRSLWCWIILQSQKHFKVQKYKTLWLMMIERFLFSPGGTFSKRATILCKTKYYLSPQIIFIPSFSIYSFIYSSFGWFIFSFHISPTLLFFIISFHQQLYSRKVR